MKIWKACIALPVAAFASQAVAENWVVVAMNDDGASLSVDKDSIRRGDAGLVYYKDDDGAQSDRAADCAKQLSYRLSTEHLDDPDWRNNGKAVQPGSFGEAALKYVCANAG